MPHVVHTLDSFGHRADWREVRVQALLWERAKRSPVSIEIRLSYGELKHLVREVERAREEHAQEHVF